jgi:eukaryotic-like serine/threonine-protein kinase
LQETVVNGRYSIVHALGGGGMARVYLAHDGVLDRDVALKVLREQFAEDKEFVERFKREAQSAAALSHPHIVQVYDRGKAGDGASYIAMEYVPGGTLKERISRTGPLDAGAATSIALQITEALQAAHERGVIHRDIKPHNVLLTTSGDAKVTDFGIAWAVSATTISQRSIVLGTASYMSPEQALGKPVTPKSDLYSLGVVLYEMLTGKLPYTAENPVAVSMKHVNEPLCPPREVNPEIPEGMNALVTKLLAKDAEERYENATEVAEDLRRVCDGLPPRAARLLADDNGGTRGVAQATVPVAQPEARGGGRRRMPWVLAATLALLALIGGWALSQGLWNPDSPHGEVGQPVGVEVPDVEGLTKEQAQRKLTASGFEVEVQPRESSAADAGKVLEQSPAAGKRVKKGFRVVVGVGDGPAPVKVPDVVGLSSSEAKVALDEANLTVGLQREIPSDTAAEGVVIEQGYPAGTKVKPGTAVNLGISSGPQQVTAPDTSAPASAPTSTRVPRQGGTEVRADTSAPASAPASIPPSPSASASAPAFGEEDDGNSGPGSSGNGNSGPGSSGGEED